MLEALADSAAVAWPLALTCATVTVAERVRCARRRERLNRGLHELRRPLQTLTLARSPDGAPPPHGTQLGLALEALADLDREINGGARPAARVVEARSLAEAAVGRWRAVAIAEGRTIELRWLAAGSRVRCEPAAIARALDNLIANALEHGSGTIRVEGAARCGRLRLFVIDGAIGAPAIVSPPTSHARAGRDPVFQRRSDPRRGHGFGVVAEVAAAHHGRFVACCRGGGARTVIELPLVE